MIVDPLFNIVLVEPEIPSNTGNIGRTCVGTNSRLDLIGPLGFEIDDKRVKRAGLDYWPDLNYRYHPSYDSWASGLESMERVFFLTTKTSRTIYQHSFRKGDYLVFGKETRGLPVELLKASPNRCLTIPMPGTIRSLNLATSVAIVVFEGLRQVTLMDQEPDKN